MTASCLPRAMAAFGHDEKSARKVVVVGGGNIGLNLARELSEARQGISTKVIEIDREHARRVAQALPAVTVIQGDALDNDILEEANVATAEAVVAVSNDDETNILASLLAKRSGVGRAVTLINKPSYGPLITTLGIDVVVSPRAITVSTILQHVRRGRIRSVHSLGDGFAEVIEAEALETSPLVGTQLNEIELPVGVIVGAIVRGGEGGQVIIPRGSTVIEGNDRVANVG